MAKCENCIALRRTSYEYAEYDCYAGVPEDAMIEDKNGKYGCRMHWKTIRKMVRLHDESNNISIAEGQRMCNPERYAEVLERANGDRYINEAKHCVGLDHHKPYKRNGKLYWRPYRNYYNTYYDDPIWSDLRYLGFAECNCHYWEPEEKKKSVFFWLNEDGRAWLAERLGIYKIWPERD